MKNLTLFSNLIADLPVGMIGDHYPQPHDLGENCQSSTSPYFSAMRAMMADEQVSADVDMRHTYASIIPYIIEGSQTDINNARAIMAEFDLDDAIMRMLTAAEYGFRPVQIKWQQDGAGFIPVDSEAKRPESFYIMRDGSLGYRDSHYGEMRQVPDGQIIPVLREASSDKPYGQSILETLWAIWQTKWINWANLERLGEKYAIPNVVALAEGSNNQEELQKIANSLAPLQNGDAAALSGVKKVEVLAASGKVDELLSAIKYIDGKITYRLTGQTLSSGNQEYGSRSMGEVHQMNALFYAKADAKMTYKALNQTLFRWIFQANQLNGRVRIKLDEQKFKLMLKSLTNDSTSSDSSIELSDPKEVKKLWLA